MPLSLPVRVAYLLSPLNLQFHRHAGEASNTKGCLNATPPLDPTTLEVWVLLMWKMHDKVLYCSLLYMCCSHNSTFPITICAGLVHDFQTTPIVNCSLSGCVEISEVLVYLINLFRIEDWPIVT